MELTKKVTLVEILNLRCTWSQHL